MPKFIPVEVLTGRIERIRAKISDVAEQLDELKREERILNSLLQQAIESDQPGKSASQDSAREPTHSRARGVVDAIVEFVTENPGHSKSDLVAALQGLNLKPFHPAAARRAILNNLGNLVRTGRIQVGAHGGLTVNEA